MFLQTVNENQNTTNYINQFLGYNHNPIIGNGEIYDMENLTSDFYPLLSPRKKRSLCLNIGSDEWDAISVTWTEDADIDISKAYATYKSSNVVCSGHDTYKISFVYDDDYISHVKLKVLLNDTVAYEQTFVSPNCSYTFVTDKNTTSIKLEMVAYADDPYNFDTTQISTYVTNRALKEQIATIRGILCKENKLAYVVGQKLYYGSAEIDFSSFFPEDDDKVSDLQLISFGALILIFPVGLWFNPKFGTYGSLGKLYEVENATVNYSICNAEGTDYNPTVSATAPNNPSDGDYWLCTGDNCGLYVYYGSQSTWQPIATTYIKIQITGADFSGFEVGDAVYMNTKYADINEGSILVNVGLDAIIVQGLMDAATDSETIDFSCERRIPNLDYVCVSNNRVWGCFAGRTDQDIVTNEIYACKLGDPTNWYVYEGLSTDSYALSMGDDGDFTGAVTYQGYPMFFKENNIYRIYGNYPAAYQLQTYSCRGVQNGSDKSICVIGEVLMYKSVKDFCIWDGSTPTGVSEKLGNEVYYDAVAGVSMDKYYVSMRDSKDNVVFFVYDISKGMWHKEDDLDIEQFSYNNSGQLYGKNSLNIYGFSLATNDFNLTREEAETHVNWFATFGKQYAIRSTKYNSYDSVEKIKPGKTIIRADVPVHSELSVFVSYDDKPFEKVATVRGEENAQEVQFVPVRCDHYQIKLVGRDDCKVYLIHTEFTQGSTR